ncbi:MAG: MBL fold metallo-hydrolase, partial [bacterium]|nr:MBL fold metallo-hydrolase [bacterium]
MRNTLWILGALVVLPLLLFAFNLSVNGGKQDDTSMQNAPVQVIPISHATAVLRLGDVVIYTDPTGGAEAFVGQPPADIVLVTDIHGDHFSTTTLAVVVGQGTTLIVPQAVKDLLPENLASRA